MARKSKRIFSMGVCADWVEIYKLVPRPKNEGEFLFAFREKRKRRGLPLITGLTAGGAKVITKSLTQPHGFKLSGILKGLCLAIEEKMRNPRFAPVVLP